MVAGWLKKPAAEVRDALEGPLVRNAMSLYGTTIVTSLFGFLYWFVAARMASTRAVGLASAVQSAALLLSIFCVFGLSTLLIGELARDKTQARSLILTAATSVGVFALIVSGIVGTVLVSASSTFREGLSGPVGILVLALLSALTTVLLVLDDSCVGLMRGDLQLRRNTVFAVSKLLILPVLITVWPDRSGTELVVAWMAGLAVSLVVLARGLQSLTAGQSSRLQFRRLFEKRRLMVGHHWLNLSVQSPYLVLPVLVTVILGPEANAAYTAASLVVAFVLVIPTHLSVVLFALAPGDEVALRREVRKTMRICLVLALASAPFFVIFSSPILRIFGEDYKTATAAMAVLGFCTYPYAVKAHYVAIARVRGRMQQAALWTMVGAGLEIGLAAAGANLYGLTGVAVGFLAAYLIEAAFYSPSVFGTLRAARGSRNREGTGDGSTG